MIVEANKKEVKVKVLAYVDQVDQATGGKTREWFETWVNYRIVAEEKYANMTLSVQKSFYKSQTLVRQANLTVFLSTFIDPMRGSTSQSICSNDELEGLVIKIGPRKPLGEQEVTEKLATGDYQIRKLEAGKLVLAPVREES